MDEKENTRELVVVDVKRYKKVKDALKDSEERYRQLFENVPIGIYRTTPDGRIVDANPALIKMAGCASFAELAALNMSKEYSRSSLKRSDFIKAMERDGEIKGLETTWRTRDGGTIHIRENAKLVRGSNGEVFFEGTIEDITLSKQAEAAQKTRTQQLEIINDIIALGNSCDSLSELLDSLLDHVLKPLSFGMAGIFLYDPELKKVNVMACRGVAKSFFMDEKYLSVANLPFSQVILHGRPLFTDDARKDIPDLSKKWKWKIAASVPMLSKGGVVGAINVACSQRTGFSPEEKSILELIGKEAGTLVSKLQTETALRESEKYYRTLIDTSPEIIVVMDVNGKLQTVNQQFLKTGGYFYDEVIGASTFDFVAGLERLSLEKKAATFIKKKKVTGSEYLFKKKNGQAVPLEVSAVVLTDAKGRPKGIIAIGRDISERKRAEEQLRFLGSITENTSDAIIVTDTDFQITYINKVAEKFFGYSLNELKGKTPQLFNAEPAAAKIQQELYNKVAAGNVHLGESLNRRKDGSTFYCEYKVMPLKGSDGRIYAYSSVQRDVSERKQAEQELRESKALLDAVVENVPLMIFLKEATDLKFIIFNRAGEELLGYGRNSLLGKNDLSLFPDEQAAFFMAKDREVLDGAADMLDIPVEPIMTVKKGQRLLHTRKVCIRGADGATKYLLGISEDITERREAEARLLAYQEQLRALTSEMVLVEERERRRIAAELHDQIGQNLALCKLKVTALENDRLHEPLKNELTVVRRLLECSIQDARSLIFDLSPPVLYELGFAAALEWLAERMQEQFHIPIEFESRSRVPGLTGDRQVILFQVVRELLMNVGKHSRATRAKLILAREGPLLSIQVNDDGVGFDAAKVFAPREESKGFGFFSIRERLNYVGGKLEVRSKPGQGSQIVLTMPLPAAGKAAERKGKKEKS